MRLRKLSSTASASIFNMSYEETLTYLYNIAPAFEKVGAAGYKEGLDNTNALDEHFQHPHRRFRSIHVAGTNGKGSCSHTLAAILQSAGYRVGLYTSPHLVDFTERIRVNGVPISKEYVVNFVEQERTFYESLHPTFFELTTALAFKYFAEQEIDIAVVEVGMGGRLDCTNIIRPILSIITNISLDHTQFLGNTLVSIAREKGGIIKEGIPCLIGEEHPQTRPVFEHIAQKKGAPIFFAHHSEKEIVFQLKGLYQQANRDTILSAIDLLRTPLHISDEAIAEGMAHVCDITGFGGRWQTLSSRPLTICDTGHNLAAWEYLSVQIKQTAEEHRAVAGGEMRIVFGMLADKDAHDVMRLLPKGAKYYFCQADTHRAIPSEQLLDMAGEVDLQGKAFPTVEQAYRKAKDEASESDFIFIGGSTYVVADLLSAVSF